MPKPNKLLTIHQLSIESRNKEQVKTEEKFKLKKVWKEIETNFGIKVDNHMW